MLKKIYSGKNHNTKVYGRNCFKCILNVILLITNQV